MTSVDENMVFAKIVIRGGQSMIQSSGKLVHHYLFEKNKGILMMKSIMAVKNQSDWVSFGPKYMLVWIILDGERFCFRDLKIVLEKNLK